MASSKKNSISKKPWGGKWRRIKYGFTLVFGGLLVALIDLRSEFYLQIKELQQESWVRKQNLRRLQWTEKKVLEWKTLVEILFIREKASIFQKGSNKKTFLTTQNSRVHSCQGRDLGMETANYAVSSRYKSLKIYAARDILSEFKCLRIFLVISLQIWKS